MWVSANCVGCQVKGVEAAGSYVLVLEVGCLDTGRPLLTTGEESFERLPYATPFTISRQSKCTNSATLGYIPLSPFPFMGSRRHRMSRNCPLLDSTRKRRGGEEGVSGLPHLAGSV